MEPIWTREKDKKASRNSELGPREASDRDLFLLRNCCIAGTNRRSFIIRCKPDKGCRRPPAVTSENGRPSTGATAGPTPRITAASLDLLADAVLSAARMLHQVGELFLPRSGRTGEGGLVRLGFNLAIPDGVAVAGVAGKPPGHGSVGV